MNEINETSRGYIGYEYKELVLEKSQISFYIDGYENFGWEMDERQQNPVESDKIGKATIRLKRDRKIMNKAELTRLQRHFEDCLKQVSMMEASKASAATAIALIIGLLGTAFMACSTFAVTHEPPFVLLCIVLAIPGFAGWVLPYFAYKKIVWKKSQELEPLIEQKREEIYEICEKGHNLLV
ncbi:MAG: hypothetical protein PHS82_09865 [Lachnospiraceae bacterium]|nr:hypothetical protein [Lachnospiraceae bacterium]